MVSAERERASDIYDPKYDGDEDDLRPLERGGMSLKMGDSGSDYEDKYPYSRINALQAGIKFAALYNFIKDYLPRAHKTKILFNGLGGVVKRVCSRPSLPGVGRWPNKTPFSWHNGSPPRATA